MPKFVFSLLFLLSLTQTLSAATAELNFEGLKRNYGVGEFIIFDLQENLKTASRFEKIDLWIAVELPSQDLLFRTSEAFTPFIPIPQAFRTTLDSTVNRHRVLEFEVQPGYGGDYTFYAVYVKEGKNPITDHFPVHRSNVAAASTTLSNRVLQETSEPDTTSPPPPAETKLPAPNPFTAVAGDSQVVLNWPAVSGAVSYNINWQIAGGSVQSVPATTTAYVHTGLQNNLNYTYWVTAVSATGLASSPSITVVATPQAAPPPPPAVLAAGESFRDTLKDGSSGPEMVVIPAGTFRMGDIQGGGRDDELPVHQVSVARFAMGKYEVTFAEYDQFAEATGRSKPYDYGWGRGNRPVMDVSWDDATAYLDWLTEQTGKRYRLPTEAEWEYAARAGTETKYWWGNDIGTNLANCGSSGSEWSGKQTAPVGSFQANPFGLYDTVGNLWEWCADPWHSNYQGAPTDGRIWERSDTVWRLIRGGSFFVYPFNCRAAVRNWVSSDGRGRSGGFRGCADLAL